MKPLVNKSWYTELVLYLICLAMGTMLAAISFQLIPEGFWVFNFLRTNQLFSFSLVGSALFGHKVRYITYTTGFELTRCGSKSSTLETLHFDYKIPQNAQFLSGKVVGHYPSQQKNYVIIAPRRQNFNPTFRRKTTI